MKQKGHAGLQGALFEDPPGFLELGETCVVARFGVEAVDPFRDRGPQFEQRAVVHVLIKAGRPRQGQLGRLLFTCQRQRGLVIVAKTCAKKVSKIMELRLVL